MRGRKACGAVLWEVGASRRMMVLLEKQVHLQKEVGAGVGHDVSGVGERMEDIGRGTYSMRR